MIGSRRKATALIAGLQLAFACFAWAQDAQIRALFPARPAGHVTDAANVLDPTSTGEIESLAERLRGATGAEIAVVTLPTIGNYDAAQVALTIGRAWGVGARAEVGDQRRNAGLVVLLVPRRPDDPNSGHIRIEVGQGLEGIVTDAAAGRVRDLMRPELAAGRYGSGLLLGVQALSGLIARGFGVSDSVLTAFDAPAAPEGGSSGGSRFPLILFLFLFILLMSLRPRGRRRRVYWGGPWVGGGWGSGGGWGGGGGGGGFGGFGGGGGFSGGGAGGRF